MTLFECLELESIEDTIGILGAIKGSIWEVQSFFVVE